MLETPKDLARAEGDVEEENDLGLPWKDAALCLRDRHVFGQEHEVVVMYPKHGAVGAELLVCQDFGNLGAKEGGHGYQSKHKNCGSLQRYRVLFNKMGVE